MSGPNVLRRVAENVLDNTFNNLSPNTRADLTTSLVRQWLTYNGQAVFITREHHFWFLMTRLEDQQTQVVRKIQEGTFVDQLRKSRVIEEHIPALLHQLSLRQSVECLTDYGQWLRLRVDPAKHTFHVEYVLDDEPWHRSPDG